MTPLGHITTAYLTQKPFPNLPLWAIITGALLPDIDFLLLLFSPHHFNEIHRLATHNLAFVLLCALIIAPFSQKGRRARTTAALITGGLLHLLLDACIDANPTNGIGVPIFWPFSDLYFSPVNLAILSSDAGWASPASMIGPALFSLLIEIPFILAAAALFIRQRKRG